MGKLKVVTVYSDNFKSVYDVFLASIMRDSEIDLHTRRIDLSDYSTHAFRLCSWYKAAELKMMHLENVLNESACGETLILTDCDIQYFEPSILHRLAEECIQKRLDFYGPKVRRKDRGYNCGFYVIRNTAAIRGLIRSTISTLPRKRLPLAEQDIINSLIRQGNIANECIDLSLYVFGPAGRRHSPHNVKFHHAIETLNVADKMAQMREVYQWYYLAHPEKVDTSAYNQYGCVVNDLSIPFIELPSCRLYDPFAPKVPMI